jgi:F-type H+-transporting ATPase subunit delta
LSSHASAHRYAKALLDVVVKEADPVKAEHDLAAFAALFDQSPELKKALTNPAVPVQGKRGVVEQLVARLKPIAPVGKLLLLLADRDRLELVPEMLAAYRERLMEHQGVVRADLVSAVPLPDASAAKLGDRLAAVTGRTVTVTTRVEPGIIGGVVAKVGSTVYDASIATQLERMKQKLVESV